MVTADTQDVPLLGMAAAVGAYLMLSTMSLFAKLLSSRHGIVEIAFWRNLHRRLAVCYADVGFGRRDILKIKSSRAWSLRVQWSPPRA